MPPRSAYPRLRAPLPATGRSLGSVRWPPRSTRRPIGPRLGAVGLSLRQLEPERRVDLPDLAHDALEALLRLVRGFLLPRREQLQQLVLLHPQQLLLRVLVDGAVQLVHLAVRQPLHH